MFRWQKIYSISLTFFDNQHEGATIKGIFSKDIQNESSTHGNYNIKMEAEDTVVRIIDKIIMDACRMGASDIHIEPSVSSKDIAIRFRIDGDCRLYQKIPYSYHKSIVARIKVMSNLDTTNQRLPQDGKIKFNTETVKMLSYGWQQSRRKGKPKMSL